MPILTSLSRTRSLNETTLRPSELSFSEMSAFYANNMVTNIYNDFGAINSHGETESPMALVYFYCTLISSVLSIIGTSIIIVTYFCFDDLRSNGRKILTFLSVADFLTAAGNILGITWYEIKDRLNVDNCTGTCDSMCKTHATITIFSSNSSYLWTVVMALHLFVGIVTMRKFWEDFHFRLFHAVCWGFPGMH